jgi:hypothetical protein
MSPFDLDPNFGLPLWRALVRYFRAYPPLVQGPQQLVMDLPQPRVPCKPRSASRRYKYLPKDLERRLPLQPSP